jgi:hypothetical protein
MAAGYSVNQQETIDRNRRTGSNIYAGTFVGEVMHNKDPQLAGRVWVFIPEFGGIKTEQSSWIPVSYASPFYGISPHAAPQPQATGGQSIFTSSNPADQAATGRNAGQQQQEPPVTTYGFWAIAPDVGVKVLCTFVDGNYTEGYWFAVIPTLAHGMIPAMGAPDGKTPLADFNPLSEQVPVTEDLTSIERQPYEPLIQQFTAQGIAEDPLRGPITSSSFRESPSRVFGISSQSTPEAPGHSFVMDDGGEDGANKLIRIRTSSGNQITMHDDTGMIYLINSQGTGWIELSPSGQIDVFGAAGINMATNGDVNFHADNNVNIHAGNCVKIVGLKGTKVMGGEELQLHGAKTMIEGVDSLHVHSCKEMMITSFGDIHMKAFNYFCLKGKCFYWNSCTAKEAEQVPPEQPADVSGYQTTVARAPSKEPYKEHDGGGAGASGAGGGTQADGTNRPGGPSAGGTGVASSGPFSGGNAGVAGWWTADRQKYASDYLVKNAGLSQSGAAGLVARWTLEAPGGPTSVNPNGGASGIAQWLGSRKNADAISGDFDRQLAYAAKELNTTEKRAGDLLRSASNADQAARGATAYERAELYNSSTNTDVLTQKTADRYNTVLNNTTKTTGQTTTTAQTPGTSVGKSSSTSSKVVTPTKSTVSGSSGIAASTVISSPASARTTTLQGAVRTSSGTTVTSTYKPATSSVTGYSAGAPVTSVKPSTITVTKTTTTQAGPMSTPVKTTTSQNIDVSSSAANPYLGRGGAQPVGADPALANVQTPGQQPTGVFDSSNPADQAVTGQTPSQEASQALGQTAGQGASSDIPAAPGGGNTGCFATGDNCDRPIDETGGVGQPGGPQDQSGQSAGDIPADASDEDIAARTIAGECRGCTPEEQAAIGEVLRNRAKANGTSVATEARRAYQFSTWNANDPNRSYITGLSSSDPTYQRALTAFKSSASTNYTYGATHYYNARTVSPTWGGSMTSTANFSSGHRFGYIKGEYGK